MGTRHWAPAALFAAVALSACQDNALTVSSTRTDGVFGGFARVPEVTCCEGFTAVSYTPLTLPTNREV